jgi:hypothetical protein
MEEQNTLMSFEGKKEFQSSSLHSSFFTLETQENTHFELKEAFKDSLKRAIVSVHCELLCKEKMKNDGLEAICMTSV